MIVASPKERVVLDTISVLPDAFRDRMPFFGLLTGASAVDEFTARIAEAFTSALFYKCHPLVVFITHVSTTKSEKWRWCVVCYLCDSFVRGRLNHTNFRPDGSTEKEAP